MDKENELDSRDLWEITGVGGKYHEGVSAWIRASHGDDCVEKPVFVA